MEIEIESNQIKSNSKSKIETHQNRNRNAWKKIRSHFGSRGSGPTGLQFIVMQLPPSTEDYLPLLRGMLIMSGFMILTLLACTMHVNVGAFVKGLLLDDLVDGREKELKTIVKGADGGHRKSNYKVLRGSAETCPNVN